MWLPAFAVPARLAPDPWTRHAVARLGASILAALALIAWPSALPAVARWTGAACLLQALTGLPCPGCGITTSLLALGRGDLAASWAANPAGLAVAVLLVGQAMVAADALRIARVSAGAGTGARLGWLSLLDRVALGGLLAAWAGRLIGVWP
jgi:hypothetical protein